MNSENMQYFVPEKSNLGHCKGYIPVGEAVCCSTELLSQKLTRSDELYTPGITLRKRWSEAFDVRDIWRVERIAATVTSDGLLKSRRIDDLMDARSRMFQALCLPIAIITLLHTSHLNIRIFLLSGYFSRLQKTISRNYNILQFYWIILQSSTFLFYRNSYIGYICVFETCMYLTKQERLTNLTRYLIIEIFNVIIKMNNLS